MVRVVANRTIFEKAQDFFTAMFAMILIFFGAIFKLEHSSSSYSKQEIQQLKIKSKDIFSYQPSRPKKDENENDDDQPKKRMGALREQTEPGGPDRSCQGGG